MQNVGPLKRLDNAGITVQNCSFVCTDGMTLSGQEWKSGSLGIRILSWHGFLDNCRSFSALAPLLLESGKGKYQRQGQGQDERQRQRVCQLVALDFPGHGQSSHKSLDHPPYSNINDIVYYIAQAVQVLKWQDGFVLMGHSMGAMASILYAGAFPEQIQQLILLDGFGPDFEKPSHVVDRLRQHVQRRYSGNTTLAVKRKRIYATLDDAIRMRQQTAVKSPGNQWLSYTAAKEMVVWALEPIQGGGWTFRHDPRLYWPALQTHTLEQAFDYWRVLRERQVPILWLRAECGWPFSKKWLDRAENYLGLLLTVRTLPGSHHFHADPETVIQVANTILENLTCSG